MKYDNPDLVDRLAAAYVLGTLRGLARQRFERLVVDRVDVREAVWNWERQLLPMADAVPSLPAPPSVWRAIEGRLGFADNTRRGAGKLAWWPALSGAVLGALLVAIFLPVFQEKLVPSDSAAERLALIQDGDQPLWVITVDEQSGELRSVAVNAPAQESDRVFELWMLPQSGPPQSFGLLPANSGPRTYRQLSPTLLALLGNAQGLAVSVEPPGGSPTGTPTGPVVYTASVLEI